ncbi:MAG: nuclear transport factor 2 family protein [Deltaproteobacteria bacterium]|nr:nuclear transport factor 2 family protein [Deltaproteobacteria bacterium]
MRIAIATVAALLLLPTAVHAKGDPTTKALTALVTTQVGGLTPMSGEEGVPEATYADGARFSALGDQGDEPDVDATTLADAVIGPGGPVASKVKALRITLAADGASAIVSFDAWFKVKYDVSGDLPELTVRASEVAVKTAAGWRIAGGAWSGAQPNAPVNAAAQKGTLTLAAIPAAAEDADARAALDALIASGVDAPAAKRASLVAIGSGPKELTSSGAVLAKAWKGGWLGKVVIDGATRAVVAPSGTVAWVTADVRLTKTKGKASYAIPFRLFTVFEKVGGAWSLVHAHFAVPPPSGDHRVITG